MKKYYLVRVVLFVVAGFSAASVSAQFTNLGKAEAQDILKIAKDEVRKHYYDTTYHGINLDAHFKKAEEQIKTAQNTGQLFGIIAQTLLDFNDSHLYFIPPARANKTEYGFEMTAHGEGVFIAAVKPGSDVEKKGVKVGDQVWKLNGFPATREQLWILRYLFYTLRPRPSLNLVIQSPEQAPRTVEVLAKIQSGKQVKDLTNTIDFNEYIRDAETEERERRDRYEKLGEDIFIWKMTSFAVEENSLDTMLGRARKCKSLILDLRGNGGGYVSTLQRLIGSVFDREIKIGERTGRKEMKPIIAKKRGGPFEGKIIVLIDSRSASASEIFARVLQLEKRGLVIGDRSAGAVMEARGYSHRLGIDTVIPYGFSVTDADLIMSDGKSLEHRGVIPDEILLPTAKDVAAARDLVLARAVALLGGKLTPEVAGKMFPIEWRK